jgi:hypothetical protein
MPTTIGQHTVATFTSPVNGTTPIDANTVRGNDNTIRSSYNNHDTDPGIHLQSSTLSARPAAGTAGRKWVTADAGSYKLWYDDGTRWHEVGNDHIEVEVIADENLVKGDVVEISGYNVGLNLPRVQKTTSAGPAFAIVNETIANGSRGYVINTGIIFGFDTTNYGTSVEPSILYTATGGTLTSTKPVSGTYQASAFLLRHNSSNGVLFVEFSAPAIVERSDNTASTVVLRDGSGNFSAGTVTANLIGNVTGNITGNADTATKLSSNRTFALTGNVTGSVSSDLTAGFSIASTIANDVITNAMISPTAAIAYSKLALTNSIVNADIAAAAAIADTKLATIATAGKVANSATTATSSNTNNAIVARDGSGNFSAGTISAALSGNVTSSNATITGGSINGTPIGGTTASTGAFSNLSYTGTLTGGTGVVNLGSGQLVKDASGNVGIGTASPGNKLEIVGSTTTTGANLVTTTGRGFYQLLSSGGTFGLYLDDVTGSGFGGAYTRNIYSDGAHPVRFWTNASERMRIDSAGNVGIGETNPGARLHIKGVDAGAALDVENTTASTGRRYRWVSLNSGGFAVEDITASSERMRIDSAGNVGIGTTAPAAQLQTPGHIVGGPFDTGSTGALVSTDTLAGFTGLGSFNSSTIVEDIDALYLRKAGTNNSSIGISFGNAGGPEYFVGARIKHIRSGTNSNGHLVFETKSDSSTNTTVERLRITDAGTVQLPSGSPGIKFGARNANLADYEEGTWTPTVAAEVNCSSTTFSSNRYTKVGRTVVAEFSGSLTITATGTRVAVVLGNVPFSIGERIGGGGLCTNASNEPLNPAVSIFSSTQILFQFWPFATGSHNFQVVATYSS